jgi:hypothetical protein
VGKVLACRKDRLLLDYFRARKYQLLLVPETDNGAHRQMNDTEFAARTG